SALTFSADNKTLFTGGGTLNCYPYTCGQIKTWNIADSSLKSTFANFSMGQTNIIAVSKDGSKIISGNGSVYCTPESGCYSDKPGVFDYNINGTLNKFFDPGGLAYALAYSPDETTIAVGTGYNNTGVINIYNSSYTLLRTLAGHLYSTDGLAFTPDGKLLISGGYDGFVKFWDYKTGALIRSLEHGDFLTGGNDLHVAVSPDGKYVASAGNGYALYVKVWRIKDGKLMATLPLNIGTTGGASTVTFTPDGKYMVAATGQYKSRGGYYGRILFWDTRTGKLSNVYEDKDGGPVSGGIKSIAFSPDNHIMAYGLNNSTFKVATIDYNSASLATSTKDHLTANSNAGINGFAYPNPFTSATNIQFTLEKTGFVSIKLYNAAGTETAIILNEKREAGIQNILFSGKGIPAGIYFYKIHTSSFESVNKLVKY
ncbi:MAG: T9SS type A sorting domain-containing protein, partial [Panacibacter sp.]